jgi:hypothetical protein
MGWYRGTDAGGDPITFPSSNITTPVNDNGTTVIDYDNFGAAFATFLGVIFPAGGNITNASLICLGQEGHYHSSSVFSNGTVFQHMAFDSVLIQPGTSNTHENWGYSIRCVKN